LHWIDPIKAGQRDEARQEALKERDEHMMSLGLRVENTKSSVPYYPVDNTGKVDILNGNLTPEDLLDFLDRRDHEPFTSGSLVTFTLRSADYTLLLQQ
jgi:hypothetical protein